jgi:ubiquinone/menaquinone biosynthesis C-methylase UbiE
VAEILACIDKIIDVSQQPRTAAVIGCGAKPWAIKDLHERDFSVVGIEPSKSSCKSAEDFLDGIAPVLSGVGEALPLETSSQRIVLLQAVLEHVDSVEAVLSESFRVLQPGGILYILTTNRQRFSPLGRNWEFRVPFYNLFPSLVKESYVYKQLHFDPRLANYAERPAVHWFTYVELCRLGRQAGFAQFYHKLDLVDDNTPNVRLGILKRLLLKGCRANPWLRALVLSQLGSTIYMLKRPGVYPSVSRNNCKEFTRGCFEEHVQKP